MAFNTIAARFYLVRHPERPRFHQRADRSRWAVQRSGTTRKIPPSA